VTPPAPANATGLDALWPWLWTSALLLAWLAALFLVSHRLEVRLTARDETRRHLLGRTASRWVRRVTLFGGVLGGLYLFARFGPLPASTQAWLATTAEPWVRATVIASAVLLVGLAAVRRTLTWFEARVSETEGHLDDIVLDAISRPAYLLVFLFAGWFGVGLLPLEGRPLAFLGAISDAAGVVLVVLFVDGLVEGWLNARTEQSTVLRTSGVVVRAAARALIYVIGGLTVLSTLGLDITPALATLGIGSAALGFALQSTVTDFLAGLMIAADQPIRVGDYIRLDEQHEGWVLAIGWRTTRLLTRFDMEVMVPNSRLAASVLVNTSRPAEDCRFQVPVFLGLRNDLDALQTLATEVAAAVQEEDPRAVGTYRACTLIHAFGPGHVEMRTWLCAVNYDAHFGLRDAFMRRFARALQARGIALQPPTQRIELSSPESLQFQPLQQQPLQQQPLQQQMPPQSTPGA
jgi:small-conductance mechanosensitive channel